MALVDPPSHGIISDLLRCTYEVLVGGIYIWEYLSGGWDKLHHIVIMASLPTLDVSLSLVSLSLGALILIVTITAWRRWSSMVDEIPYPPGPPARSLLSGNSADIPSYYPWLTYTQWGKVYGEFYDSSTCSNFSLTSALNL